MQHPDTQSKKNFFQEAVLPEIDVFARDYGFLKERATYLRYINGEDRNISSFDVPRFIKAFNKRNSDRLWFHDGQIWMFTLSLDDVEHIDMRPVANPGVELLLLNHKLDEHKFTTRALWASIIVFILIASDMEYFLWGVAIVGACFIVTTLAKRILARFRIII